MRPVACFIPLLPNTLTQDSALKQTNQEATAGVRGTSGAYNVQGSQIVGKSMAELRDLRQMSSKAKAVTTWRQKSLS